MSAIKIALIGQTNVGKTTLLARLTATKNLAHQTPGTTRDRQYATTTYQNHTLQFCDTPGYHAQTTPLEEAAWQQTMRAFHTCGLALFILDGKRAINNDEWQLAKQLRKTGKPMLAVVNKCENKNDDHHHQAWQLGLGEPITLSARHGIGIDALLDRIIATIKTTRSTLPPPPPPTPPTESSVAPMTPVTFALIGRPNSGKSTLANALLGEPRVTTSPIAGTTTDPVWLSFHRKHPYQLIDTAGIRRKHERGDNVESLSIRQALLAIRHADVILLLIDMQEQQTHQDLALAERVHKKGKPLILVYNKSDIVRTPVAPFWQQNSPPLVAAQRITISAKTKRNIHQLFPAIERAVTHWRAEIKTSPLNQWLERAQLEHPLPLVRGKRPRLRYGTQINTCPPHFLLFGTDQRNIPQSYHRYLSNSLRQHFQLLYTPLRLHFTNTQRSSPSLPSSPLPR
ncbi:MAG: ribosome biogenesis GTPase Der [Alphaproteobacteria bacterium GM202ARS2]|nr:ribosome biogenesis GTPase Der [Alphaproteobacteria bacterium GM202ARS2]